MISDVTCPPSEENDPQPSQLWDEFVQTYRQRPSWDTTLPLLEDAFEIYAKTGNPEIRALAQAEIRRGLMTLNDARLFLRVACSPRSEPELAAFACSAYLNHPKRTTEGLESLFSVPFEPGMKQSIAQQLLLRPDCSLDALELLGDRFPKLMTHEHLARKRDLEERDQRVTTFLVRILSL
jgi:hypothetical protein